VSRTRIIAAPPRAVWDVLADFGSISSWAGNVDHSCVLEHGPDESPVGTSRRVQVGRNTLVERITEFDAPTALGYTIEGLPRRLRRLTNRWQVRPAGEARTEVTLTSTVEIGDNLLARAVETVIGRAMAKQSDAMLTGLAQEVEDSQ
jgi:uncharacterized protein YndB with AHSA1/START domain